MDDTQSNHPNPENVNTGPANTNGGQVMDFHAPLKPANYADNLSQTAVSDASLTSDPGATSSDQSTGQPTPVNAASAAWTAPATDTVPVPDSTPKEQPAFEPTASWTPESPEPEAPTDIAATATGAHDDAESAAHSTDNPLAITAHASHRGTPIMAIAAAVIVAVVLAGVVVVMYLKNKPSQSTGSVNTPSSQIIADKPQASASDVDSANRQIESSLSAVDEAKDFPSAELSDASLGL